MDPTRPVPPPSVDNQVHHWLERIASAMRDGDTNPHIVFRDILGEVYAQGHRAGYTASLGDRPLKDDPR